MPHWRTKAAVDIQTLDDDLMVFSTVDPISRRGKRYYGYLLRTARGNVLIHAPDGPAFYRMHGEAIDAWGGVQHLFLTHDGDYSDQTDAVLRRRDAKLLAHRAAVDRLNRCPGRRLAAGFDGDQAFADGISILHLPGHTRGFCALLRRREDGQAQLFAGHLLLKGPLGWRAAAAHALYEEARTSLARLRDLPFDVLMPDRAWLDGGPWRSRRSRSTPPRATPPSTKPSPA
jgi:glyoxylase-like metal-dependent hydrolase (beta-lactamase superfamily II)